MDEFFKEMMDDMINTMAFHIECDVFRDYCMGERRRLAMEVVDDAIAQNNPFRDIYEINGIGFPFSLEPISARHCQLCRMHKCNKLCPEF